MEKGHVLDMDMVMEHFCRHVENQITYAQKNSYHLIFQIITQQFQQTQKNSNQSTPTFRNKQLHQPPSLSPTRNCICNMPHQYTNCWYLHPEFAKPGW